MLKQPKKTLSLLPIKKNTLEVDLGTKQYGNTIEINFNKNWMETVQYIDFYFVDNSNDWLVYKEICRFPGCIAEELL
jgi:hypothetical protein